MITFEVKLLPVVVVPSCPLCMSCTILGTVEAEDIFKAKDEAVRRWPDARPSEMVFRKVQKQEVGKPAVREVA